MLVSGPIIIMYINQDQHHQTSSAACLVVVFQKAILHLVHDWQLTCTDGASFFSAEYACLHYFVVRTYSILLWPKFSSCRPKSNVPGIGNPVCDNVTMLPKVPSVDVYNCNHYYIYCNIVMIKQILFVFMFPVSLLYVQ